MEKGEKALQPLVSKGGQNELQRLSSPMISGITIFSTTMLHNYA